MKITITTNRLKNGGKPYINAKTGDNLDTEEVVKIVERKVRQRLATLEDLDDQLTIEIYIDEVNRD